MHAITMTMSYMYNCPVVFGKHYFLEAMSSSYNLSTHSSVKILKYEGSHVI